MKGLALPYATALTPADLAAVAAGLTIVVLVTSIFGFLLFRRRMRFEEERHLTPLHEEICGAWFDGWLAATYPFVRVSVYPDFIVISSGKRVLLPWADVGVLQRGYFSAGIHIEAFSEGFVDITIFSMSPGRLFDALTAARESASRRTGS